MTQPTELKQLDLNKLEWSPTSFRVSEFLNRFSLPQIVKVNEGYYGEDEESSLGADQVLTLHLVKATEKVSGRDYRGREVNIPLNCPSKVEVRPSHLKDVYESVDELCSVFPNHVRISQGYYSASKDEEILNVGDKLRLKSIDKSRKGHEILVCVNQNGQRIELPRDCIAGFQPLADGEEYYMAEVVSQFTLPVYVQFVNPPTVGKQFRPTNEVVFNSSLGAIHLEKKYTENLVIASAISNNGVRTVVTFPREIDIRICVCDGMLRNTSNYAQICEILNNGVDLTSLRHIDAHSAFKPRNSVREFTYHELVSDATSHLEGITEGTGADDDPSPETGNETAEVKQATVGNEASETEHKDKVPGASNGTVNSETTKVEVKERSSSVGKAFPGKPPSKPVRKQNSLSALETFEGSQSPKPDAPLEVTTADSGTASLQTKDDSPESTLVSSGDTSSDQKVFVTTVSIAQPTQKKPSDVSGCSVKQVSDILRELGMAKYVVKFESEMIDGEMLACLNDEILQSDFGMNKLHCMKLRKYLEGWRPKV